MNGILLVDKPPGISSHDVVYRLRRILGIRKIGHTGTLDPQATGLLVALVGNYTKRANCFINDDKVYRGVITFGKSTETYDGEGRVTGTYRTDTLSLNRIREKLREFTGFFLQEPPMYSAVKVGGRKLYKLARAGKMIPRNPRMVHVKSIKILNWEPPCLLLRIHCSKGTYIRSIAHELGVKVGAGAYLSELRRLAVGKFSIKQAMSIQDIEDYVKNCNTEQILLTCPDKAKQHSNYS